VSSVATTTNTGSNSNSPSNSAPSATIPVTISLDKHADTRGLDQAAVSVNFDAQVANHVLSVPVTALLATQGGGYAVQLAAPPHKLVAVTPGLFAAGYVQISGPGIQDGMQVTDSQG
jgi:multidrug efflux pump subunit AcrA (membrane-fusion protein)